MSITIGVWDESKQEICDPEQLMSADEFFMLCECLSLLAGAVEQIEEVPECAEIIKAYKQAISDDRSYKDQRFQEYAAFIAQANRQLMEDGVMQEAIIPDADDFHPDIRIFVGGFILKEGAMSPADIELYTPAIGLFLSLTSNYAKALEEDNPGLAQALAECYGYLQQIGDSFDQAIAAKQSMAFSY